MTQSGQKYRSILWWSSLEFVCSVAYSFSWKGLYLENNCDDGCVSSLSLPLNMFIFIVWMFKERSWPLLIRMYIKKARTHWPTIKDGDSQICRCFRRKYFYLDLSNKIFTYILWWEQILWSIYLVGWLIFIWLLSEGDTHRIRSMQMF